MLLSQKTSVKISQKKNIKDKIFRSMEHIKQLHIYPPEKGRCTVIAVYEIADRGYLPENGHYLSIDLGLHNLMTCYDSGNGMSFILGRKYLSLERYFHKEMVRVQAEWYGQQAARGIRHPRSSRHIRRLYKKKQNTVKDYLHKVTRYLADYCRKEGLNCVVIGDIRDIRENKNMGHRTNQKFHGLPYNKLYIMLEYKLKMYGIRLEKQKESYSSHAVRCHRKYQKNMQSHLTEKNVDCMWRGKKKQLSVTGLKQPQIIKVAA